MPEHVVRILMFLTVISLLSPPRAPAGDKVYLNRPGAAVRKDTGRTTGAVPDIAHTPPGTPSGPVPMPYPDDGSTGSKGVKPGKKLSPGGAGAILPAGRIIPLIPEIDFLSPLGCFVAGDRVTLGGKHFGAEQGGRKLVLTYPVNRSRTIGKPRWGDERITFTMPPGIPFNATGKIAIHDGKTALAVSDISFCNEENEMPDSGGSRVTQKRSPRLSREKQPSAGALKGGEWVSPGWSPPSRMDDGVEEEEKPPGQFGKMIRRKSSGPVPGIQTGPALTDPRVLSITASCGEVQRISASVTVANTTGVPTAAEAKTEISVIAKKVKPSKSPNPLWEDVKVVLGSHATAAGFVGQETFAIEKAVPYFGNPKYVVRAKVSIPEAEESASNNSKGKTIFCSW